jgi:hypothetical protein
VATRPPAVDEWEDVSDEWVDVDAGDPGVTDGRGASIQAAPGGVERALRHTGRMVSAATDLSPLARMLKGEGITPAFTGALKTWIGLGKGIAQNLPDVVTAPAKDIGTLAGLEMPPGVEEHDPAEAAVNLGVQAVPGAAAAALKRITRPSNAGTLLRNRARARAIDLQRPSAGRTATAEDIALEIFEGTDGLEGKLPGVGVGTRRTLANRAAARKVVASEEQNMLQNVDTPVGVSPLSQRLRAEAKRKVTTPPNRTELVEEGTGILDEFGDEIRGTKSVDVPGTPVTKDPALVSALEAEADFLDKLASQYPDGKIPGGELFKQRAVTGARISKAYEGLPGDVQTAGNQAGKAFKAQLTDELRRALPEVPSAQIDRGYRVWRNAAVNFERSRLSALTARGWQGLRDLLVGRLAGVSLGAAADLSMGGYGVAGALTGAMLGESAVWGSLRATSYVKLAKLLNNGNVNGAAELLAEAGGAALPAGRAQDVVSQAERNRKAREALNRQAEGVIEP